MLNNFLFLKILRVFLPGGLAVFVLSLFGNHFPVKAGYNFKQTGAAMAFEQQAKRVFKVKEILDGVWSQPHIEIAMKESGSGIRATAVDLYSPPPKPNNPEAIHMVLAFQMASGKTRNDFAKFKEFDAPWVVSNNGSNAATIWTERSGEWVFDAFEDVVFASKADFERAYAGNDELGKAAEGLFGEKVLVAIIQEQ